MCPYNWRATNLLGRLQFSSSNKRKKGNFLLLPTDFNSSTLGFSNLCYDFTCYLYFSCSALSKGKTLGSSCTSFFSQDSLFALVNVGSQHVTRRRGARFIVRADAVSTNAGRFYVLDFPYIVGKLLCALLDL